MSIIDRGIQDGIIKFDDEQKNIYYCLQENKRRNYNNPEEQVQVETYLKLIFSYGYSFNRIRLFVSVPMGVSTKEADIVVYNDDDCTKPLIIIECKKEDTSELEFEQAVKQASSYAYALSGTVKYLWITSKIKSKYFLVDKDSDVVHTIPDIPRFGITEVQKFKYAKGGRKENENPENNEVKQKYFELKTVSEDDLTKAFKQAHNSLWAGGQLNPSEAFDELDKLIFCKIWDERSPRKVGEPYHFQVFNESVPKNATKDQRKKVEQKIADDLYNRVVAIYAEGKKKDPEVFKDDIRLDANKVKTVVGYLESINLSETDLDSKGKAFETFMGSYFRGDFGQYFTPRPIVRFIVNALPITHDSKVLDTSCGSGGFLLYALDKVRTEANSLYPDYLTNNHEFTNHYRHWHDFAEKQLYGIELNEQIARTAKMNMIIHDDGHTNVISSDGLLRAEEMQEKSGNKGFEYGSFDFIITNPPFGSSVKQTEKAYLHQYNLGIKDLDWLDKSYRVGYDKFSDSNIKKLGKSNQSTEVLFIEQCWNFLNEGGYLAIVLPDGVLTNSSLQYVRDNIEEWFRIVAVVSMPQTAFSHTGAGVKSSVLFLRKWSKKTTEQFQTLKQNLQTQVRADNNYLEEIAKIEDEKKATIKDHTGFENTTDQSNKKSIEKTEIFTLWKKETSEYYNQKVSDLKDKLSDIYMAKKQEVLPDYQIFMAIAEDIGYDATGRETGNNELDLIGQKLVEFITDVNASESI